METNISWDILVFIKFQLMAAEISTNHSYDIMERMSRLAVLIGCVLLMINFTGTGL